MKDLELINQNTGGSYKIEKAVFVNNQPSRFDNGGFFTAFSAAFREITDNKELNKLDLRLLLLILSYMGNKRMMPEPNVQILLSGKNYAEDLQAKRPHVVVSFQRLEKLGFIKRDKKKRNLAILINPDLAYNGKIKKFPHVWNQLALDFGLQPKGKESKKEGEQDWGDGELLK